MVGIAWDYDMSESCNGKVYYGTVRAVWLNDDMSE